MKDVTLYAHGGELTTRPGGRPVRAVTGITVADIQADRWKARQADQLRRERDCARAEAAIWLARQPREAA